VTWSCRSGYRATFQQWQWRTPCAGLFLLVAVDYRGLGLWFHDYLDQKNSVTSYPRMTLDRLRFVAGMTAAILLGLHLP